MFISRYQCALRVAMAVAFTLSACVCPAFSQTPKTAAGDRFDSGKESIGGLKIGLPEKALPALVSCNPAKLKEIYEGATGEYVQTWRYAECGLELKMSSAKRGAQKTVAGITLKQPGTLATAKGIRIGSTEQQVMDAYGKYRDRDGATKKGRQFVAGSIYDGMIFEFNDGKVVRIFLGAAAE